jgi:hypothetical protein
MSGAYSSSQWNRVLDLFLKILGLTIENAMTVVGKLGYKYSWADSICIDQRNMDEMHHQISHMHQISHGALAKIVVLDSLDASSEISGVEPEVK